jgi:hypothetical protein
MPLRDDRDALESLPLKLIIVALVATMSVVPAGQALESFRNRDFAARAQIELETIISAAQTLMVEGPGSVRTIHLDFRGDGSMAFGRLSIGDARGGPNMSSAILHMSGGAFLARTATEPTVWMMSISGGSLTVDVQTCDLRLSAKLDGRTEFVLAELV